MVTAPPAFTTAADTAELPFTVAVRTAIFTTAPVTVELPATAGASTAVFTTVAVTVDEPFTDGEPSDAPVETVQVTADEPLTEIVRTAVFTTAAVTEDDPLTAGASTAVFTTAAVTAEEPLTAGARTAVLTTAPVTLLEPLIAMSIVLTLPAVTPKIGSRRSSAGRNADGRKTPLTRYPSSSKIRVPMNEVESAGAEIDTVNPPFACDTPIRSSGVGRYAYPARTLNASR